MFYREKVFLAYECTWFRTLKKNKRNYLILAVIFFQLATSQVTKELHCSFILRKRLNFGQKNHI
ncbi:hypothetical protein [African swine fever virus]